MPKSLLTHWMAKAVVASLVMFPALATAQNQETGPSQELRFGARPPRRPPPRRRLPRRVRRPRRTRGRRRLQHSLAARSAAQDTPMPNVKPGSEADVSAIGNRGVGKGLDFYSLEKEIALGKQLAQEVDKSAKFIDDPVVDEYVNRIGQNLVRNSDARVPFTIKVIDSDTVNAFALPGGFFYVNSGLILHADEEAELAGVMAHEIAHVCARHGTKQATKGDIMQMASIPAMIFIPYSWAGYAIYQGMNFAIPLTFLKFSRNDEREADYLGLAVHVQGRIRSERVRGVLREGRGGRKERARHDSEGFFHAPADAGPHRGRAEGNRDDPAAARAVHRDDLGIRQREEAAADDRGEHQGRQQESEQADAAQAHLAEQGRHDLYRYEFRGKQYVDERVRSGFG